MADKSLTDIAKKMANLDICMMTTQTGHGLLTCRPMSNNGDVEYNGSSYFFTFEGSRTVKDIKENPEVNLGFTGKNQLYVSIAGKATMIHSKATMKEHWVDSLKQWFKDGIDTPGMVLLHIKGNRIKYWQGEEGGEVKL